MSITSYEIPLDPVASFKYLGIVLSAADNYWPEVVHNLRREQQKWAQMSRVLSREGAGARNLGRIYGAVVQAVMMYRLETGVMKSCIGRVWGQFHHRVAHRLTAR